MYKIDIYHCTIVTETPMLYANGQTRLIEGIPHTYVAELNSWRRDSDGHLITEQQVQEMMYMMYNEDAWDDPKHSVTVKTTGSGTITVPARPKAYFRDYKQILAEVVGAGARGGTGAASQAGAGGGAGGYSYKLIDWDRSTQSGITLQYSISSGVAGFTLGNTNFEANPGSKGIAGAIGTGGTAGGGDVNIDGGSGGEESNTAGGLGGAPYHTYFPLNNERYNPAGVAGANATSAAVNGSLPGAGGGGGFSADGFTTGGLPADAHVIVTFI